jgi:hypothetical protein
MTRGSTTEGRKFLRIEKTATGLLFRARGSVDERAPFDALGHQSFCLNRPQERLRSVLDDRNLVAERFVHLAHTGLAVIPEDLQDSQLAPRPSRNQILDAGLRNVPPRLRRHRRPRHHGRGRRPARLLHRGEIAELLPIRFVEHPQRQP